MIRCKIHAFFGGAIEIVVDDQEATLEELTTSAANMMTREKTNIYARGIDGKFHVFPWHNIARIDYWEEK